jgi:hypothetical protein
MPMRHSLQGILTAFLLASVLACARVAWAQAGPGALPPLPDGVAELRFGEFFEMPVGRYGLKPTLKFLGLDGKRIRMLGYMARQETPLPGFFIFSPIPVNVAEEADGMADDLPPSIVFVHMPRDRDKIVPYTPGLLLLTGTLSLGAKEEADRRVSHVRLMLDPPQPEIKTGFHHR